MANLRERIEQRLRRMMADYAAAGDSAVDSAPLFQHLDEVIDIVAGIRDYSVDPYMDRVREVVCSSCRADAQCCCVSREAKACGLDRYFPDVVAIIEQELKAETQMEIEN